jgi:hypothetical protein
LALLGRANAPQLLPLSDALPTRFAHREPFSS